MLISAVHRRSLLGIDLGTSSIKAVVTDEQGVMLAHSVAAYPVCNPRQGWAETDPDLWLAATIEAARRAVQESGTTPIALGLSGQMHGLVPTAGNGHPVRAAMLWADSRAVPQLASYRSFSVATRTRLANPLSPGMAGPMLAWLAVQDKESYARTRWALQPKDWLRAQLTGEIAAEPSDASATLLYDVVADTWDWEVIDGLGLDPRIFPTLLPRSSCQAGFLTAEMAKAMGLQSGIPVAAGAADTAAAALGSGLVADGDAQLTIGTGAQIVTPLAHLPTDLPPEPLTHTYRAATDAGWYRMGAVLSAGLTLGWVCRVLGASWPELFASASSGPAEDDPYFLPHLNGERTPYLDPHLRGAWTGLSPQHDRQRLLRAALEGVACAIADAVDQVIVHQAGTAELRLAGGGSTEPAWRQLLADILGYPLRAADVPAASGRGAAILAGRAAGIGFEPMEFDTNTQPITAPHADVSTHYQQRRQAFTGQVRALRQLAAPLVAPAPGGA